MERKFKGIFSPCFEFREIGSNEYAFREVLLDFVLMPYAPIMRGIMAIGIDSCLVHITGRLNWTIVSVAIAFVLESSLIISIRGFAFGDIRVYLWVAFTLALAFAIGYITQIFRFDKIARAAIDQIRIKREDKEIMRHSGRS